MTSFVKYQTSIKFMELVINETSGGVFATMSATARMCNCEVTQIRRIVGDSELLEVATVKTLIGDRLGKLLNENQIFDCLAKYNPSLLAQCAKAGLRVYLYGLAGYEVKPTQKPDLPTDKLGWMRLAVEAEERAIAAEAQNRQLQAQAEADAPLVKYAKAVEYSETSIDFNSFAKMIGTGRTRLFRMMRDNRTIMKNSTLPYQEFIEAGYFEVSQEIDESGRLIPFALVTGKGQIWLHQRLKASEKTQKGMAAAIIASVQQSLEID
jgi:phage antirepressor YoqD-like protein